MPNGNILNLKYHNQLRLEWIFLITVVGINAAPRLNEFETERPIENRLTIQPATNGLTYTINQAPQGIYLIIF